MYAMFLMLDFFVILKWNIFYVRRSFGVTASKAGRAMEKSHVWGDIEIDPCLAEWRQCSAVTFCRIAFDRN